MIIGNSNNKQIVQLACNHGRKQSAPTEMTGDKITSVRIWRIRFTAHCMLQEGWRDISKAITDEQHWVPEKAQLEISAFNLGLPDDVLR